MKKVVRKKLKNSRKKIKSKKLASQSRKRLSKEKVNYYKTKIDRVKSEIAKAVIGQQDIIEGFLRGIIARGHVLVEGVPGLAKTHLIKTLSLVTGCDSSRIQFTVDLLPTDILGVTLYNKDKGFYTQKGPIFSNFIMADEINRAPPKTQSALLEAMQEHQVTISGKTYHLQPPFFVMATQNPIESEGTYKLPEAQVDRFLFKLLIKYPNMEEEKTILNLNSTLKKFADFKLNRMLTPADIIKMQKDVHDIYLSQEIENYIVKIVDATRNPDKYNVRNGRFIELGGSPRASIALYIASKVQALISGSNYVTPQHVKQVAPDALRHRILLNYEGEAEKVSTDQIIQELLKKVPVS